MSNHRVGEVRLCLRVWLLSKEWWRTRGTGSFAAAAVLGFVLAGALLGSAPSAKAQSRGLRVVSGAVVNDAGTLLPGATVFLQNPKTKTIRSYTTPADGTFRFTQVNMGDDQEVWAQKDGKKSSVKTVSSWDSRKQFECELKLK